MPACRHLRATSASGSSGARRQVEPKKTRRSFRWAVPVGLGAVLAFRSEEHTSELQSLMRTSYAVFCLKKKSKSIISHTECEHTVTTKNTTSKNNSTVSNIID